MIPTDYTSRQQQVGDQAVLDFISPALQAMLLVSAIISRALSQDTERSPNDTLIFFPELDALICIELLSFDFLKHFGFIHRYWWTLSKLQDNDAQDV